MVIFAGKLTPYKGVKYLIYAAKKIKGEVLILGDGLERKNLEEMTHVIVDREKNTNGVTIKINKFPYKFDYNSSIGYYLKISE